MLECGVSSEFLSVRHIAFNSFDSIVLNAPIGAAEATLIEQLYDWPMERHLFRRAN